MIGLSNLKKFCKHQKEVRPIDLFNPEIRLVTIRVISLLLFKLRTNLTNYEKFNIAFLKYQIFNGLTFERLEVYIRHLTIF